MNDSFLNFGNDDWECQNLGASKSSLGFSAAAAAVENSFPIPSGTTHSDFGGRGGGGSSNNKADPLTGKSKTTHDTRWGATTTTSARPFTVAEDSSIMNYRVDEWASDDEDDNNIIVRSSSKNMKNNANGGGSSSTSRPATKNKSSTPALDKLKSRKMEKKAAGGGAGAPSQEKPRKKKSATKKKAN